MVVYAERVELVGDWADESGRTVCGCGLVCGWVHGCLGVSTSASRLLSGRLSGWARWLAGEGVGDASIGYANRMGQWRVWQWWL